ncbi:hypothetical protein BCD48_39775 [Pseudofrankia sp. BMG5.36]|nr:hypothetical protein BCD48_39775 [Pseudofrankia sp. BMG5.36]
MNKRSLKIARPRPEFFQLFSEAQVIDMIYSLDKFREIPRQYDYLGDGAALWDEYMHRQYEDDVPNMLRQTISLLEANRGYIDQVISRHGRINIVDIGPGNALPVKDLLRHLIGVGKLGRYIAIDISPEMLAIAERNIKDWFGDAVQVEGHVRDISREWFADAIACLPAEDNVPAVNICLFLGSTLPNFRAPDDALRNIVKSMGARDYLLSTTGIDSDLGRERFQFAIGDVESKPLPPQYKLVVDLLGIEQDYYETEMGFDEREHARYLRIRLKHALTLEFKLARGDYRLDLKKGETLLVWRARHNTAAEISEQLTSSGLNPRLISQSDDHDYMLVFADLPRQER